jgi:glyoxylate carboligase
MNGAESLVHSLLRSGVTTCFSNPGTSEMHFVAALDRIPGMHCVLGLFEGVVTGAADGYARMAGKPLRCCIAVQAWLTAWPIYTMLAAPAHRSSTLSATRRPTTGPWTLR